MKKKTNSIRIDSIAMLVPANGIRFTLLTHQHCKSSAIVRWTQ